MLGLKNLSSTIPEPSMRPLVLLAALLLCASATADIRWIDSYVVAKARAKKSNKLLFVFFSSPG